MKNNNELKEYFIQVLDLYQSAISNYQHFLIYDATGWPHTLPAFEKGYEYYKNYRSVNEVKNEVNTLLVKLKTNFIQEVGLDNTDIIKKQQLNVITLLFDSDNFVCEYKNKNVHYPKKQFINYLKPSSLFPYIDVIRNKLSEDALKANFVRIERPLIDGFVCGIAYIKFYLYVDSLLQPKIVDSTKLTQKERALYYAILIETGIIAYPTSNIKEFFDKEAIKWSGDGNTVSGKALYEKFNGIKKLDKTTKSYLDSMKKVKLFMEKYPKGLT